MNKQCFRKPEAMNKEQIKALAQQVFNLKQSINDIVEQWEKRYTVRAMLSKILVDSSISYSIDEIEAMLREI
jgi:hypothetical protein